MASPCRAESESPGRAFARENQASSRPNPWDAPVIMMFFPRSLFIVPCPKLTCAQKKPMSLSKTSFVLPPFLGPGLC